MPEHREDTAPHYALAYLRHRSGKSPRPQPIDCDWDALTDEVAHQI